MSFDEKRPAKLDYATPDESTSRSRRIRRLRGLLLIGMGAVIITIAVSDLFTGPRCISTTRTLCKSHLSQIGKGLILYTSDPANRGAYPKDLLPLLVDGEMSPEVFICPGSNDTKASGPTTRAMYDDFTKPGRCSYIYRAAGLTTATVTPQHVLAHERLGNHTDPGINVLYGDGSVEWLDADKAKKLIAELDAGYNPPRK